MKAGGVLMGRGRARLFLKEKGAWLNFQDVLLFLPELHVKVHGGDEEENFYF